MGRIADWLKARGVVFSNPAADLERIVGCINRIAIDAKLLDERPASAVQLRDIEALQHEAVKFRKNLTAALAMNPRYRPLASSVGASWRLHAARDTLTTAEVRLEALRGRLQAGSAAAEAVQAHESERNRKPANARWSRLDPVKEWAFQQRRDDPLPRSRAAVIKRILPEVKARARDAGEALSGDDESVIETITGWFRKAKIK